MELSWYEFIDSNPEHHFGIPNADWTDKPAVANLRYQVSLFKL